MIGKKLKNNSYFYSLLVCVFILAGCGRQQQFEVVDQIIAPDMTKAAAMQIAEDVLVKMHFTIEKADPQAGFLRTRPLAGAQFFELWRSDNVGSFNTTEANLHSIQRIVELDINQENEKLLVNCDVWVYRLSLPEQQVGSSGRAYKMLSQGTSSLQVLTPSDEQKQAMAWIELGQDKQLSTKILKRIEERLKNQG